MVRLGIIHDRVEGEERGAFNFTIPCRLQTHSRYVSAYNLYNLGITHTHSTYGHLASKINRKTRLWANLYSPQTKHAARFSDRSGWRIHILTKSPASAKISFKSQRPLRPRRAVTTSKPVLVQRVKVHSGMASSLTHLPHRKSPSYSASDKIENWWFCDPGEFSVGERDVKRVLWNNVWFRYFNSKFSTTCGLAQRSYQPNC